MTWAKIYSKYEDTGLMNEFFKYYLKNKSENIIFNIGSTSLHIKDIWGYLICFAETKEITLEIMIHTNTDEWLTEILQKQDKRWKNIVIHLGLNVVKSHKSLEQAMNWCAEKLFEVSRGT